MLKYSATRIINCNRWHKYFLKKIIDILLLLFKKNKYEKSAVSAMKSHPNGKKALWHESGARSKSAGIFFKTTPILSSTMSQVEES